MKRFFKRLILPLLVVALAVFIVSSFAPKASKVEYGLTFSAPYAQSLGLDWRQAYLAILDELKPKYIRLSAYWDSIEPRKNDFNFDDLDFQVNQANSRGTKIILTVGRRLPRWPECHDPSWIGSLSAEDLKNAQLAYMEKVVEKYINDPNIIAWQVENEPFLSSFGICPPLDVNFLDSEIALVKRLDLVRPVLITDSGELSFWIHSGARGDMFGTTLYRYVFSDVFKRYWTNYIPSIFYRFKAGLLVLMHPEKKIVIIELEAEPWTTNGITSTSLDDQFKTMSLDKFNTIVGVAKATGFSPQYFWGTEWWYWMKTTQNHPEFWDRAKQLFNQ